MKMVTKITLQWYIVSAAEHFFYTDLCREVSSEAILEALRDETMNDPRDRIELAHNHTFYRPSLLGQP